MAKAHRIAQSDYSGWFPSCFLLSSNNLLDHDPKLEASRISLNTDLDRLNQRRIQEQQSIVLATNELARLQRQFAEKEELIRTLNTQVSNLTKENKELQPLISKIEKLQTDRDKFERQTVELRSRLAYAHMAARNALSPGGEVLKSVADATGHPEKFEDLVKNVTLWTFQMGKWRAVYDADMEQFKLSDFIVSTNAVTNSVTAASLTPAPQK